MSSSSGGAVDDPSNCVVCGAPVAGGDGGVVCTRCSQATDERRPRVTPCQQVTVERGDVTLTKRIVAATGAARIEYSLSSTRSVPVRFRVLDVHTDRARRVDGDGPAGERSPADVVDVTWWILPDEQLEFSRRVSAADGDADHAEPSIDAIPWLAVDEDVERCRRRLGADRPDGRGPVEQPDGAPGGGAGRVLAAVPAYNEGESIASVVAEARRYADAVLVVDDGSEDDTVERAQAAGAFVVEHDENRGYGAALQTIFAEAHAVDVDYLAIVDADGQHDPSDITKLVAEQRTSGADVVVGNRFGEDAGSDVPLYRRFGLAVINRLANASWGRLRGEARIADTQSGFRVYTREVVASLVRDDRISDRMGASTDILAHANRRGYEIREVPTTIEYVEDVSNYHPVYHGLLVVGNIAGTVWRDRPLAVLGLPGLLLALGGLAIVARDSGSALVGRTTAFTVLAAVGLAACFTALAVNSMSRER